MADLPPPSSSSSSSAPTPATASTAASTDYSKWSRDSLIARLHALEAAASAPHQSLVVPPKKDRPHKSAAFDFSAHPTRHIALKFLYVGSHFNGLEYSGNDAALPTVEEALFKALLRARLVPPLPTAADPESIDAWPGGEDLNYSKCGRTDKGVSAYDQVVGITVRSRRPPPDSPAAATWNDVRDELPYPTILNRLLPPTIRVLSWAPNPPADFSARFNCHSRTYRYYFTNPMLSPLYDGSGALDIKAMQLGASYFLGSHDFRNFCKLDASKQITNFIRYISTSRIVADTATTNTASSSSSSDPQSGVYYFELQGSAFLWHQVRHMMGILFLIGQRLEPSSIVKDLLDISKYPTKPVYQMASEHPLVLWRCEFPEIDSKPLDTGEGWVQSWRGERGRDRVADCVFTFWQQARVEEAMMRAVGVRVAEGRVQPSPLPPPSSSAMEIAVSADVNPYPPPTAPESTAADLDNAAKLVQNARNTNKQLCIVTGDGEAEVRKTYKPIEKRDRLKTVEETNRLYASKKGTVDERREKRKRKREERANAGAVEQEDGEEESKKEAEPEDEKMEIE